MGTTAIIGGVMAATALAGAGISAYGQKSAAEEMAGSADAAAQLQYLMYLQNRADLEPWRLAGGTAVNKLLEMIQQGPGKYQESPYYQFLLEQGTKGLERGAAARGMLASGAEGKALMEYGQNLASTDYDNWLRRWYNSLTPWQSLAGLGLTGAQTTTQAGTQAAQQQGQYNWLSGQSKAAGTMGMYNTIGNTMSWMPNYLSMMYSNQPMTTSGFPAPYNNPAALYGGYYG